MCVCVLLAQRQPTAGGSQTAVVGSTQSNSEGTESMWGLLCAFFLHTHTKKSLYMFMCVCPALTLLCYIDKKKKLKKSVI